MDKATEALLLEVSALLKNMPKFCNDIYVMNVRVSYGKQAAELKKKIDAAIDKDKT